MEQIKKLPIAEISKNGKTPETKTETNPKAVIQKMAAPVIEKTEEKKEVLSFDDRMHRLNVLFELQAKHAKLTETNNKLNDFTIVGVEGATLTIEDSDDNEFLTRNTEIISEVVTFVKAIIAKKRQELEAQIRW